MEALDNNLFNLLSNFESVNLLTFLTRMSLISCVCDIAKNTSKW